MTRFVSLLLPLVMFFTISHSTAQEIAIEERFDVLAGDWLEMSGRLKTYQGIQDFCATGPLRLELFHLLKEVHHYDSLILFSINDQQDYLSWNPKEEKKTFKDINELETEFSQTQFIAHMRETCAFKKEIETHKNELKNGIGVESYDGKILLLETQIRRYLGKIDKLVLKMDDHLHVLHIDN